MTPQILIAYGVLCLIAVADVWTSRLSRASKILWSVNIICLAVVGVAAWVITRGSAHQPVEGEA